MSHDPKLLEFALAAVDRMPRPDLAQLFAASARALCADGGPHALREGLDLLHGGDASLDCATFTDLGDAIFALQSEGAAA